MAKEFSWDEIRAGYKARRLAEGATEEELALEEAPPDLPIYDYKEWLEKRKGIKAERDARPKNGGYSPETGKGKNRVPGRDHYVPLGDDKVDRIIALRRQGFSNSQIARQVEVTATTVKKYLTKAGLAPIDGRSTRYQ